MVQSADRDGQPYQSKELRFERRRPRRDRPTWVLWFELRDVGTRNNGGWLAWDFGLEGGVAELHGFEDDIFDGAACRDHGEYVLGVGNHDIEYVGGFGG